MKKLFLIPLMAMLCTVMAWGTTYQVGNYADLKAALQAGDATLIELTADITYPGTWATFTGKQPEPNQKKNETLSTLNPTLTALEDALTIRNSLTLDGKGFQLNGFGKQNVNADASTNNHRATLVIRPDNTSDAIQVTVKNLSLGNTAKNLRYYGIIAFDGVSKVIYDNINVVCNNYSNQQALCFTGANAMPIDVTIKDSYLNSGNTAYSVYILKPIIANILNTKIEGWCAIYYKYRNTAVYGDVAGSRGSEVTCDACQFICPNVHNGESNSFALFPIEDDGITMNFNNCSFNAEQIGDQQQSVFSMQYRVRDSGYLPIELNITGDNTHMYNISMVHLLDQDGDPYGAVFEEYLWWKRSGHPDMTIAEAPLSLNIEGGTYSINPTTISFPDENGNRVYASIPSTHEAQQVIQGGDTLYRVVKKAAEKAPGVLYDLNDLVAGEGEDYGDNPVSSFDLSNGDDMTLNNEVTTAGYVSVSDDPVNGGTTVTIGQTAGGDDQTLIINNGLSVEGSSQVIVETGANLMIGEGGITTEDPSNIVIEANENGAASLLLEPSITVNQNPYLTVKMETNVGKFVGSGVPADIIWVWHYFAFPMKAGASWTCTDGSAVVPTYFQGWNYGTNDWESIVPATMKPFYGYILTYDKPYTGVPGVEGSHGTKVTYTFTGNLVGNEDLHLEFSAMGWNFFGNSYTAYISTKTFLDNIINDPNVGATIYLWDSKDQQYRSFTRDQINTGLTGTFAWANEVAPMQTFILQKRQAGDPQVEVNYAEAIWNNPRYVRARGESSPAPARVQDANSARAYITIAAANGQNDYICLMEDAKYSDAYDNGGDGAKYMNAGRINMYITANNEDYGTLATDNLAGKAISFQTNDQINYTLSISDVLGSQYAIRDIMTNTVISMTEGATYDFVAQPNSTIEGRFVIVPMQNMPTDVETVENNATVKGIYTIMGQYVGEDFDILPAGVYVVDGVKVVK